MTKDWIITIGIDKFYLTQKECDFYLVSLANGAKYVKIDDTKVLGANFQSLVHTSVITESKMLAEGRWQCNYGKWHQEGWSCYCDKLLPKDTDLRYELSGITPIYLLSGDVEKKSDAKFVLDEKRGVFVEK
jgi:hypothetical protein